jgi:hypothetical protein
MHLVRYRSLIPFISSPVQYNNAVVCASVFAVCMCLQRYLSETTSIFFAYVTFHTSKLKAT